jgi:hypothetical protein
VDDFEVDYDAEEIRRHADLLPDTAYGCRCAQQGDERVVPSGKECRGRRARSGPTYLTAIIRSAQPASQL